MSDTTSTPIVTNTDQLSAIADAIVARAGNPKLTKNTVLNLIAAGIAGPKHNWGFLKSHGTGPGAKIVADPKDSFCWTENGLQVVLDTPASTIPGQEVYFISSQDLLLIEECFFGLGDVHDYIANGDIRFELRDKSVHLRKTVSGKEAVTQIPADTFRTLLRDLRQILMDDLISKGAGEAIHAAFITVAEGQTDLDQYENDDESAAEFSKRIDAACLEASRLYITSTITHRHRRLLIAEGRPYDIVNDIIDHSWTILPSTLEAQDD